VHEALERPAAGVDLFACSLGAYFSLVALADRTLGRALLLAPLVDMAAYIERLMQAHAVSDDRLRREATIELPDGQFLDWQYLTFARNHPLRWPHSTDVLWGERDEVVPEVDIARFAAACGARVRRIDAGHAFTSADDAIVDAWLAASLTRDDRAVVRP
jgi:pimeloyl-ACP methyl ester carboxylesterase